MPRRRLIPATGALSLALLAGGCSASAPDPEPPATSTSAPSSPPAAASTSPPPEVVLEPPADLGPSDNLDVRTVTPAHVDVPRERISGYTEADVELQPIPEGHQPYQSGRVREMPFGLVDEQGVRVVSSEWGTQDSPSTEEHPIAQAQYALALLESYRLSGDPEHLTVALRNAERIVERHVEIDGAWYFPYDFDFDLHRNDRGVFTAPWTSGMATGQALSLFVRLTIVTGDQRWRDAADATFAAFLQAPDGEGYFSSFVDEDGLLWLEEYSRYPVSTSERVLNGHMWSMYGLWDYWMLHDHDHPEAESLFRGALHTLEQTALPLFRQPGANSLYSAWQRYPAPTYHHHHQAQFLMIYRMTHDPRWVSTAALYRDDHPYFGRVARTARLSPATTTAYRVDDVAPHPRDQTFAVLEERDVDLEETVDVAYDRRGRIPGGPAVIRLSEGELAGWWVEEGHGLAWSVAPVEIHSYVPTVSLSVDRAAEVTVYSYDADGEETGARTVQLEPGTSYQAARSALVTGRLAWQLEGGELDGWWLPFHSAVHLEGGLPGATGS